MLILDITSSACVLCVVGTKDIQPAALKIKLDHLKNLSRKKLPNSKINFESYLISEYASHCNSNIIFKYIRNLTHLPSVIHLDDEVC